MIHHKTSFSGHDKFDCKIDWIVKGLICFKEDNQIFQLSKIESSISKLGLGINMIKSLNHWMKVLGLIDGEQLTTLANCIIEKDPYLENTNTLWILHWNLAKNFEKATLYNKFFNKWYLYSFTKEELFNKINSWLLENDIKTSESTIKSDIDVFLRMYTNSIDNNLSLFGELNILNKSNNLYMLNINSATQISDGLFLYVLTNYINGISKDMQSLSVDDIQKGVLSIQKSLCMNENSFFSKINNIAKLSNNKLTYSEASGIRQIYIHEKIDDIKILSSILE